MKRGRFKLAKLLVVFVLSLSGISLTTTNIDAKDSEVVSTEEEVARRHFKSGASNNNGANPALLKNEDDAVEQLVDGSISFNYTPLSTKSDTRFGIYLKYIDANNFVYVGTDASSNWFYEYKVDGKGVYPKLNVAAPQQGEETSVDIKWSSNNLYVSINGQPTNAGNPYHVDALETLKSAPLRLRAGTWGQALTDILFYDVVIKDGSDKVLHINGSDMWALTNENSDAVYEFVYAPKSVDVKGRLVDEAGSAIDGAKAKLDSKIATTDINGNFVFTEITTGQYTMNIEKDGYLTKSVVVTVAESHVDLGDVTVMKEQAIDVSSPESIETSRMKVGIDDQFPRVIYYEMNGEKMYGQTRSIETIKVNGFEVKPTISFEKQSETKASYILNVKDDAKDIDAVIDATLEVIDNTLEFKITNIQDNKIVKTIEITNHSLVSVRNTQVDANFAGSQMSTNTHRSGDTYKSVNELKDGKNGYMFAMVNTNKLAASIWTNSENNVTSDWQRITATTTSTDEYKSVGLGSTYWTHQKGPEYFKENSPEELPCARIIITDDVNEDNLVDWQDAAIATRTIMEDPKGADTVADLVAMRIAMNFGSQAQNPFLVTADNVKKINLHTDGLGQMVLLKGYGSEGHDSGHLDYADIGKRIGGTEDMKKLLELSDEYGVSFGIHVNASETYPESKYFEPDRLKKNADGSYSYGWNWIDQGINIDANYDLLNGRRDRFVDLYNELGGSDNKLDFIYVDVWGNGQSGDNGTWASSQLAKEIKSLGWRVSGEWGYAFAYDSTFQHWAADLTYGGYSLKGINSDIARFIQNHQKDSWVGDYPSYGGAAINPLLGGYDMKDFEGWQGRNDYGGYIENLYDDNLPSKYVQHFEITNWKNGTPISMNDNGESYTWTPEMEIGLKASNGSKLVIHRKSNDINSSDYKMRTMTLDDKVILDGEKYLIPWLWDESGNELEFSDQKLYHWNQAGGTSTWNVPSSWSGNVVIYELSEDGKINPQSLTIAGGQVSINAKAKTAYVIHRGESSNPIVSWSEGMHIVDTGFNSGLLDAWTITGEGASIELSQANNRMLALSNTMSDVELSQTMTDLIPGQSYAVYVGVDNRSDAKAYLEVSVNGETKSTYTSRSIAKNYIKAYAHNTNNSTVSNNSYFQNMYIFFDAPNDGSDVKLTLKREAGTGVTYMDDIRIFENESNMRVDDITFSQDFEDVPQGIFPFVIGGIEGVEDNRTHLSEKNEPYTQVGWNNKVVNDVIEGNWSLKTNGLTNRNKLVYQTIPQNFRFEPGVTYNISFDYEMGTPNAYKVVIGNEEYVSVDTLESVELDATYADSKTKTAKFRITGSENGQTWFGIYSSNVATNGQGTSGGAMNFAGYGDFILDNLTIVKTEVDIRALQDLINDYSNLYEENYTSTSWSRFVDALNKAKDCVDDFYLTQDQADQAYNKLSKAISDLEKIGSVVSGNVKDSLGVGIQGVSVSIQLDDELLTTTTDSMGNYTIPGVLFGTHTIVVDHSYYKQESDVVTTKLDVDITLKDFELEGALTRLSGNISAVGHPIENATITISNTKETHSIQSDSDGNYMIEDIFAGAYQMNVSHPEDGYDVFKDDISINKSNSNIKNVMIEPESKQDYFNEYESSTTWENLAGNTSSTTIKWHEGQTQVKFPGGHANVYDASAPRFINGVVEMDVTAIKDSARLGVLLRANDMNNRVYIGTLENSETWFVEHWGKGGNSWSGGYAGPGIKANEQVHIKVEIVDRTVKLWVNDTFVLEKTMPSMQVEVGSVGMNTRNNNEVLIDNVSVISYDAAEDNTEHVVGHVSDNNVPISNLDVKIESKESTSLFHLFDTKESVSKIIKTDMNGNYKFKNIPFGEYIVSTSLKDGTTISEEIKVEEVDGYILVKEMAFNTSSENIDKSSLINLINEIELLNPNDYTSSSWSLVESSLIHAKDVIDDDKAIQSDVDSAYQQLLTAKTSLITLDRLALQTIINEASLLNESDYTSETWKEFTIAYQDAMTLLSTNNITQKEIDTAVSNLELKIKNLIKVDIINKDNLDLVILSVASLDESKYTPETWKNLQDALKIALEIQASNTASQIDVDTAEMNLHLAINQLVFVDEGQETGNDGKIPGIVSPEDPNKVTTGIVSPTLYWLGLLCLSSIAFLYLKKKKRIKN